MIENGLLTRDNYLSLFFYFIYIKMLLILNVMWTHNSITSGSNARTFQISTLILHQFNINMT